jgi:DNA-binding transcriptional MerR regulator/effector-binding domain-containing protein
MSVRISIGDFSRMTHLSVKALRHYHDVGLLQPASVDPSSGYRYYTAGQLPVAQVIRRLRDLDMPLEEVRSVIEAPDVDARNAAIVTHLQRMERQLAETRETVGSLRSLLQAPPLRLPVEFRAIPAATTLAVSDRVTVAEFAAWWGTAFTELHDAVRTCGLELVGAPGALYPGELFEQEVGQMTAFVQVAEAPERAGRARRLTVPAVEAAVAVHEGAMAELDKTYAALGTEVAERGAIGVDGPIREYYLVSPFDVDDESRHRTEVAWPVFRTAVPSP